MDLEPKYLIRLTITICVISGAFIPSILKKKSLPIQRAYKSSSVTYSGGQAPPFISSDSSFVIIKDVKSDSDERSLDTSFYKSIIALGDDSLRKINKLFDTNKSAFINVSFDERNGDSLYEPRPSGKFGTLGYHYYPIMTVHEAQPINVYIKAYAQKSSIRDTLRQIVKDEDPDRNLNDTGVIGFKEHIPLYKFVTIKLTPLDSGITTDTISYRQAIDTINGNKWSWSLYANSASKSQSMLLMTIYCENPHHIEKRYIHIKIRVEDNLPRIVYNYLVDNIHDTIYKILVPAIAAIWGVIFLRRVRTKKHKNNMKKEEDVGDLEEQSEQ